MFGTVLYKAQAFWYYLTDNLIYIYTPGHPKRTIFYPFWNTEFVPSSISHLQNLTLNKAFWWSGPRRSHNHIESEDVPV
jgi:hypothetical protein